MNIEKITPYLVILQLLLGVCVFSGYITLWINTALMENDPSVSIYYNRNKKASLLIGIPLIINILIIIIIYAQYM